MENKDKEKQRKKQKDEHFRNVASASASHPTVQRYGSAAKEHLVAYSGVDNGKRIELVKGLKQIAEEKINPDYEFQNIHQQAGFSAEVKEVARSNAENIIKGNSSRKIRTDDIGSVNDPLSDTVVLDQHGNIIEGSQTQIKFLGASEKDPLGEEAHKRALQKLESKRFRKYLDNDIKIEVPSDQYDKILTEADEKIGNLYKQLENQQNAGNLEQVNKIQEKIDTLENIKKNLRKSSVSSEEAVFARLHPKLSTAVDIAKVSHQAGVETAVISGAVAGTISISKNVVAVVRGEEEPKEAAKKVVFETSTAMGTGYVSGFAGTTVKSFMSNSANDSVRNLSNSAIPALIVTSTIDISKVMKRYISGEIDTLECLEMLGESGTNSLSSAMFAAVFQAAIPIPAVGGLIGGMVGYSLSSASYGVLVDALKDEKIARKEREEIERVCKEHIKMIREYRAEIDEIVNEYLSDSMECFNESFNGIKMALAIGDVDMVISNANSITEKFGGETNFKDMDEFEKKMILGETFKL